MFNGTTNTVSGTVSAHNATFTGATVTSKDVTLDGDFTVNASNVVVDGVLKLTSAGMTAIQHGSQVSVGDLSVAGNSLIRVGSSEFTAAEYEEIAAEYGTIVADDYIDNTRDTNTNSASTGVLEVTGETRLNGSTLFVDPEYGMSASVVALNTFAGSDTTAGLLGTLDGSVVVGKNAIVGTGFENAAALEQAVAKYRNANGSLNAAEVGSIFYVNGQLNVADGEHPVHVD